VHIVDGKVKGLNEFLQSLVTQFGIIGVFLVSLLGTASIIFPIPYTIIIFLFSASTKINPLLIIASAALGSTVGEFTGYFLGYTAKSIVKEDTKRRFDAAFKVLSRYKRIWFLIVFIFALTPLPDDLLIIPLGILRFNFLMVFIPCLLGKLTMFFVLVYGGRYASSIISLLIKESGEGAFLLLIVTSFIILVAMVVGLWKINWEKLLEKFEAGVRKIEH